MNWSWFLIKSNSLEHTNEFFLELSYLDLGFIFIGLAKLIAVFMMPLLIGSSFVGLAYFF